MFSSQKNEKETQKQVLKWTRQAVVLGTATKGEG